MKHYRKIGPDGTPIKTSLGLLRREYPNVSFPQDPSDELLATFGVTTYIPEPEPEPVVDEEAEIDAETARLVSLARLLGLTTPQSAIRVRVANKRREEGQAS